MAKKQSREEKLYHARMKKQIDLYGYYQGEFLPGTDATLDDDPKIETVIKRVLRTVTKGNVDPSVVKIIKKQVRQAEAGSVKSAEFLFDRAYGKPQQSIQVSTEPNIVINHSVISVEEIKKLE